MLTTIQSMRLSAVACVLLCVGVSAPATAADKELLDILLSNGAITQAQYDELLDKDELKPADVEDIKVTLDKKGLNVKSGDGDFAFKIGGRMHADVTAHSGDRDTGRRANDGTELRRARIEMGGMMYGDWKWVAQVDLADNVTSLKDFALTYTGFEWGSLTIGHQKQPYSLAIEMSSNDLPFVERSIDAYLVGPFTDRALGIRADASGERWFAAAGLFGESVAPRGLFGESSGVDPLFTGDEGWGMTGRYVFAPVLESDRVLHLGVRASYREPADNEPAFRSLRLRDETTHFSNLRIVDTGLIQNARSATLYGPEAAWAKGRFSLTGEYNDVTIERSVGGDLGFDSWHVAATWSLGGESRAAAYRMSAGEFKGLGIAPGKPGGTWELAARYASIDLNAAEIIGGSEDVFSMSANWYVNPSIRFLFDWSTIVRTDESNAIRQGAEGMNIFTARAQYVF